MLKARSQNFMEHDQCRSKSNHIPEWVSAVPFLSPLIFFIIIPFFTTKKKTPEEIKNFKSWERWITKYSCNRLRFSQSCVFSSSLLKSKMFICWIALISWMCSSMDGCLLRWNEEMKNFLSTDFFFITKWW